MRGFRYFVFVSLFAIAGIYSNQSFAANLPYLDEDFSCVDQTKANQYVKDFNVDVESFGGLELCKGSVDTKKLFNDLSIIENGHFNTQGNNKLIRNFIKADSYYNWMKGETRSIQRGNDIPYATAYNSFGNFTMQDGWSSLTTLGRVGTVIHEARHTAGYRHYPCNQGPYGSASLDACDRDYQTGGSHSIEMEYYARVVVLGQNFHPVYKSMARLMAMARANFVFNQAIITPKEQLVVQSETARVFLLDKAGAWQERRIGFNQGELKRTSFGVGFFDGSNATAIDLYSDASDSRPLDDLYSYFKLLKRNPKATKLFEEFDLGNRRYAVRIGEDNQLESYNFPSGKWGQTVSVPANIVKVSTSAPSGQSGLYLVSSNGAMLSYSPTENRITNSTEQWDPETKSITQLENRFLVLKTNGQVIERTKSGWNPWNQSEAIRAMVSAPIYDAFEVQK